MRGDAWKYKEDNGFIRRVTYFLLSLQVECRRFSTRMIQSCSFVFEDGPSGKVVISHVDINPSQIKFNFGRRLFATCKDCGDLIESFLDCYGDGTLFKTDYGICWRCEPEKYKLEPFVNNEDRGRRK